jgi:hypothetical protein
MFSFLKCFISRTWLLYKREQKRGMKRFQRRDWSKSRIYLWMKQCVCDVSLQSIQEVTSLQRIFFKRMMFLFLKRGYIANNELPLVQILPLIFSLILLFLFNFVWILKTRKSVTSQETGFRFEVREADNDSTQVSRKRNKILPSFVCISLYISSFIFPAGSSMTFRVLKTMGIPFTWFKQTASFSLPFFPLHPFCFITSFCTWLNDAPRLAAE